MARIDLKNCHVYIKDGATHVLEIKVGEGNISYEEKRSFDYFLNRGKLDTVRQGNEEPVDVKIDLTWEFLRSDGSEPITVEEALKRVGAAAAWTSSASDQCEPYAVDIEIINSPPCLNSKNETILLSDFRWESLNHDVKASTVSTSGKCNITAATVTRTNQTT